MSSRRIPDAASVTPFPSGPPGIVSGRSPTGASESPERPSRTRKGARVSRRVDRSSRPEEERFNIGAPRNTNGARHSTRRSRRDRPVLSDCNDAVPNYPPPSFQEAMESSPALLICPSTLTLVSTTLASPVATLIPSHLPHNMSSIPDQSVATSRWTPPDVNNTDPESNSDSDDSLLIIEGGSVPPDHGLPAGPELEARVRENYRSRHGVEFPGSPPNDQQQPKAHFESRGRSQQRPPALDLTKAYDGSDNSQTSTPISPTGKRRFLSLSPLRTMFPSKGSNPADRPQTAHPTPGVSPYMQSPKGSSFFRSTTSLATASFLKLPLSSSTSKDKPEKRRFFSKNKTKVKESQSMEALDSWEEVSTSEASTPDASETQPASLMSMVAACQFTSSPPTSASPTRSVSFTYGALPADAPRPLHASLILPSQSQALASTTTLAVPQPQPQPSPQPSPQHQDPTPAPPSPPPPPPPNPANSIHPLSLLDRKVPFVQRPVKRSHIPTRPRIQVPIPVPLDPVVTTVRTRLPQNAPQSPPAVHPIIPRNSVTAQVARPSPLSLDSFSSPPVEAPPDSSFWQAVDTPLPSTPVKAAHPVPSSPVTPNGPLPQAQPHAPGPVSRSPSPVPPSAGKAPTSGVSTLVRWTPPLLEQAGVFSRAPSPFVEEPLTPTRHHYSGRPLPRPPGKQARNHIDSTFAPNEGYSETPFSSTLPPCPEGLLIDLDDDVEEARSDLDSPSFVTDLVDISSTSEATSITPINVLAPTPISPASSDITFNPSFCSTPPPSSRRGDRGMETNPRPVYSELTDLDLLASRIAEDEDRTRNGSNYDALLLVAEFMGHGSPPPRYSTIISQSSTTFRPEFHGGHQGPRILASATSSSHRRPNTTLRRTTTAPTSTPTQLSRDSPPPRPRTTSTPLLTSTTPRTGSGSGNISLLGCIEVLRRRETKEGKVKVKLSLCGVAVDRCGICLSQFKEAQRAALTSLCQHAFHDRCLQSWLARSRTCPLCRVPLDIDL